MLLKLGSKLLSGAAATAGIAVVGGGGLALSASRMFSVSAQSQDSLHQFSARDIDGHQVDLSKYAGKVCVVVNVASK